MQVIAHNIRSLHNIGAIFRSADAFGITKIWLTGYTGAPPRPEIAKVALGSQRRVPFEQKESIKDLIAELRKQGISIMALETGKNAVDLNTVRAIEPSALIFGNEVAGLEPEILAACDQIVTIPMCGQKRSLNVSVAAGIAMFALTRK